MADKNELEDQVTRLTALVEEMSARIAKMEGKPDQAAPDAPRSRRDLLKMGGAAALGAVGAAALRVMPAAATTGNAILAGLGQHRGRIDDAGWHRHGPWRLG